MAFAPHGDLERSCVNKRPPASNKDFPRTNFPISQRAWANEPPNYSRSDKPQTFVACEGVSQVKDRAALAPLLEDIKAEIERRKKAVGIGKALKDTAKKGVTTKNKDFSDKLVTNAFVAASHARSRNETRAHADRT